MKFKNRTAAGLALSGELKKMNINDGVVLALPRGGVPVGFEIARTLGLPLEVFLSKKIGYPDNPELAVGAVTLEGAILNSMAAAVDPVYLEQQITKISMALMRQYAEYCGGRRKLISLLGKTVILVDDGVATGNTLFAAVSVLRKNDSPTRIIVAVPVAPTEVAQKLRELVDDFVCLLVTDDFFAIGAFYQDFAQVDDEEVIRMLKEAAVEI